MHSGGRNLKEWMTGNNWGLILSHYRYSLILVFLVNVFRIFLLCSDGLCIVRMQEVFKKEDKKCRVVLLLYMRFSFCHMLHLDT
jgi:hypothetical protein